MSIFGNLKMMEFVEFLQWVVQGQKIGILIIDLGVVNKKVFFEGGVIVVLGLMDFLEQFGYFFVSYGYIIEFELMKVMEMQEEMGMLFGKILVIIGGIIEEELWYFFVLKIEESIYDMFFWKEVEFCFVDDENFSCGMILLVFDVIGIILQGMNCVDEWNCICKVIFYD